jgi:hypothetical protein
MKSFRKIVSEVAQPKAGDEKHFKDKHIVTKVDYPVDVEDQFTGGKTVKKAPKRRADHDAGEDEKVYEALDPVNKKAAMGKFKDRADKDIDNDGDVDSSDKYLHARRKAITKAIHKEEAEELDEISRDLARSYIRKAAASGDRKKGIEMAGKKAYSIGGEPKVRATEEAELDEVSGATLGSYYVKAAADRKKQVQGAAKAFASAMGSTADVKKAQDQYTKHNDKANKRQRGMNRAMDKLTGSGFARVHAKEEVEQLDELSPNTLHRYIKGASADMKKHASMAGYDSRSRAYSNAAKNAKRASKRLSGITSASGRLADKANADMYENAWEEIPMMMRQLQFIEYAAGEISDYLNMGVDPEEWFQNKLAGLHQTMLSMYAYAQGEMQMSGGMYGEEAELDEAVDYDKMTTAELKAAAHAAIKSGDRNAVKAITAAANKKIASKGGTPVTKLTTDPKKLDALKKQLHGIKKEEAELDEAAPKIKPDFLKTQREKDRAHDASMGRTPTGRKKVMTSTQRSMASMRKEEAELDEATPTKKAITRALQGMKVQPKEKVTVKKAPWEKNEEVELDESITKMSHGRLKFHLNTNTPHGSYSNDDMKSERDRRLKSGEGEAYRKAKAGLSEVTQTAMKKTVTYIDPEGHSRTRNVPVKRIDKDEHGQDKIRESVEMLDEAFKAGMVKLKDGGSVVLKKEDADLLNKMFKDLSTSNRKKMQEVAMKDKNGFDEILGFAREAL